MLESELEYMDNPWAFYLDSSSEEPTPKCENTKSESANLEVLEEAETLIEDEGTLTYSRGEKTIDVSTTVLRQWILSIKTGRQRVLMAKPRGLVFNVDFLMPNMLEE